MPRENSTHTKTAGRKSPKATNLLKVALLAFWLVGLTLGVMSFFSSGLTLHESGEFIREFIASRGIWAPVVYITFYSLRSLVFFPASVLTVLAGVMFGPLYGLLYTVIGENISANISFLVGRYFAVGFRKYLQNKNHFLSRIICASQKNGFLTVLFMRLAYVPFDLVGYSAGMCHLRQREFALGTFLGTLPGLFTFTLLGSSVVDTKLLLISLATFITSFTLAHLLKRNYPAYFQKDAKAAQITAPLKH